MANFCRCIRQSLLTTAIVTIVAGVIATQPLGGQQYRSVARDGSVAFDHYHRWEEVHDILRAWHRMYPDLTELYSIGRSYEGVELMVMEVTNEATGTASEKPALYLDGGIHAAELTGSEVALYTLGTLLKGYGDDPEVTRLLDTRAFYIRPKFNPDGSNLVLTTDQSLRSSVHPVDQDDDGLADEDPADDLDGDGWLTRMRIPDPEGDFALSPDDDRIMVRRETGTAGLQGLPGPYYRVESEGIDNDGDGRLNEDGFGGLDMNRNFPRNWALTYLQPGAGDFPLSEPETYATVRFVNDHPNINFIIHGHTAGGFVYRLPSASSPSLFDPVDLSLIVYLGEFYSESTGREVRASATHPTEHRYGTLISFGYWDRGIIGWVPEYSPPPAVWVPDANGDGEIDEIDWHAYNDTEFEGRYFSSWTPVDHPQLGAVEVGGWHRKYWGQNPPLELLEAELEKQVPWFLYLAAQTPVLEVSEPRISELGGDRYRVEVTVSNSGFLPTHGTDRGLAGRETGSGGVTEQVVHAPVVTLQVIGGTVVEGGDGPAPGGSTTIGHLAGSNDLLGTITERARTVSWVVHAGAADASIRVTARSDRAGTVRTTAVLRR